MPARQVREDIVDTPVFQRIAIIGMGLIGASMSAALKERASGVSILGVDVLSETRRVALEKAWADEVGELDDPATEAFIRQADLVVIATPLAATKLCLERLAAWNYEGIITDTLSTKHYIVDLAGKILPHPERYVPGHPMAGSEKSGIEGARADLFQGAHWILCPNEDTPAEVFPHLHTLLTSIGARVISLPREDHDEAVAIVSHVPHMVASALVELACKHADDQQALFRLAAGGFKDSTRIAAGSPKLWTGIAFDNSSALVSGIDEICSILKQFTTALTDNDRVEMERLLTHAAQARRDLPAAWVPSTEKLLEVRIPMENNRGVVAEVTTIASQVGCNIQSIEIDHITADRAVLSMIFTDEGDIGQLSTQLISAGYTVSFSPLSAKEYAHVE